MTQVLYRTIFAAFLCLLSAGCGRTQGGDVINCVEDLSGKSVSVIGGSVQDILISQRCPDCKLLRLERETDSYLLVETGKAAACIASSIAWDMAEFNFDNIVEVGEGMDPRPIAFCFNKSNGELRERFNVFLADFLSKNDINAISREWADPECTRQMPRSENVTNPKGTFRFVTSTIIPPYEYIKNGEVCGTEMEILARFAESQNMRWEFIDVVFSGLINYVQSGKADIGASTIVVTPERQQSVDFSIPMSMESSKLLVNRKYAPDELLEEYVSRERFSSILQAVKESLYKNLIKEERYRLLLRGFESTLLISFISGLLGTLLGILLCFCLTSRRRFPSKAANAFVSFMGYMPQVVFLMVMFYVIFGKSDLDGVWVASLAFALCFGASTCIIFKSAVQSIDKGQSEAALSLGFGKVKAFLNVILPQVVQRTLPVYKGEFISLIKATSIVGYIAVFDVTKAGDIIRSRTYDAFVPLLLVTLLYFIIIWAVTAILDGVESGTRPTRKKFFK